MYDHVAKDEFGGVLGCIKISDIVEDSDRPIVTFDECIILDKNVRSYDCKNCAFKRRCNYVKMGIELNKSDITINLGFEFDEAEYDKCLKAIHERKERELQQFATRR